MTTQLPRPSTSSAVSDDDFQPIRALNDLLFCERRCAMHRIENVWVENVHTLEGTYAHQRAHARIEVGTAAGVRAVHGVMLRSNRLQLVGKTDVVEFHRPVAGHLENPLGDHNCRERPPWRSLTHRGIPIRSIRL